MAEQLTEAEGAEFTALAAEYPNLDDMQVLRLRELTQKHVAANPTDAGATVWAQAAQQLHDERFNAPPPTLSVPPAPNMGTPPPPKAAAAPLPAAPPQKKQGASWLKIIFGSAIGVIVAGILGVLLLVGLIAAAINSTKDDPPEQLIAATTEADQSSNDPPERTTTVASRESPAASSTTSAIPINAEPEIGQLGGFMDGDNWSGGVEIVNPTDQGMIIEFASLVLYDDQDRAIETTYVTLHVLPGEMIVQPLSLFDATAIPVRVELEQGETRFIDQAELGAFTISDIAFVAGDYGLWDLTGEISSAYSEPQEFVSLYVGFYDADGNLVGADETYIDLVPSGGAAVINESLYSVPEHTSFVVAASP